MKKSDKWTLIILGIILVIAIIYVLNSNDSEIQRALADLKSSLKP